MAIVGDQNALSIHTKVAGKNTANTCKVQPEISLVQDRNSYQIFVKNNFSIAKFLVLQTQCNNLFRVVQGQVRAAAIRAAARVCSVTFAFQLVYRGCSTSHPGPF